MMIKILKFVVVTMLLIVSVTATAAAKKSATFNPVNWASHGPSDLYTINSQSSTTTAVAINVNLGYFGINLTNCGTVTHVTPGSSVVCPLAAGTPVSFSADGNSNQGLTAAEGTYQIK